MKYNSSVYPLKYIIINTLDEVLSVGALSLKSNRIKDSCFLSNKEKFRIIQVKFKLNA